MKSHEEFRTTHALSDGMQSLSLLKLSLESVFMTYFTLSCVEIYIFIIFFLNILLIL
jgi:hypothetical protein